MITLSAIDKPLFVLDIPTVGRIKCRICRHITYKRLKIYSGMNADVSGELPEIIIGDVPAMLGTVQRLLAREYLDAVDEFLDSLPDLFGLPSDGSQAERCRLNPSTYTEKIVSDYTGLDFTGVNELDHIDFRLMAADAYKFLILQNKHNAVEYLNDCYDCMHETEESIDSRYGTVRKL